jgi:transcriptional regulator with XRE-family HTH domain
MRSALVALKKQAVEVKSRDPEKAEYIRRLKLLRILSGDLSQQAFAERLGLKFKTWNEYERSGLPLTNNTLIQIRRRLVANITDWLLFGDRSTLTPNLVEQLQKAEVVLKEREQALEKARQEKRRIIASTLKNNGRK